MNTLAAESLKKKDRLPLLLHLSLVHFPQQCSLSFFANFLTAEASSATQKVTDSLVLFMY